MFEPVKMKQSVDVMAEHYGLSSQPPRTSGDVRLFKRTITYQRRVPPEIETRYSSDITSLHKVLVAEYNANDG